MIRNLQYYKFCAYGFLKNLRFFEIFFILFLKALGLSYLSIGLLYSVRQITINIMEIPSGLIADSFGHKRALLFSFVSYLGSFFLFYFSSSIYYLGVAMVFYGLGEAFRSGTHKAIILNYLEAHNISDFKTRYYGSTRSWSQFGLAVVALLSALFFYFGTGYRTLFLITVIPYVLDLINVASYPAEKSVQQERSLNAILKMFKSTTLEFLNFFRQASSLRPMFSAASYIAFFKTVKDYLQPILLALTLQLTISENASAEREQALVFGIVFSLIFLMTSFVSRNAYKLEEHFKQLSLANNLLYLGGILSTGLAGLFLIFEWKMTAVLIFVVLYLVQNARRPLMISYLSSFIDSKILASGLSATSQLETVIIIIFAPLLGYLIDGLGIGGGLIIGSAIFLLVYPFVKLNKETGSL